MRGEFLRLVGCVNESLRLIMIYYTFKYTFRTKTTLLDFGKTSYNDFVLARSEFLWHIGAPNESLRLIIIYYMFKYLFVIKTTLLESLRCKKSPLKARFRHKLLKGLTFCAK